MTSNTRKRGDEGAVTCNRRGMFGRLLTLKRKFPASMNGKCSKGLRREEGATLVEFALASTILLAMLFGTIEVGLAVYSYDFTSEAARDGVRYAIVRGTKCSAELPTNSTAFGCYAQNTDIQAHLRSLAYPGINSSNITTTTKWYTATSGPTAWTTLCATNTYDPTSSTCAKPGNAVQVEVDYSFPMSVPFVPAMTINMKNTSMMVISN